jgi:hypothetical protein
MLVFSDYGGAHKDARYEVMSFLATTQEGISEFLDERRNLRDGPLGTRRRMAYKSLNDNVRRRTLPAFLDAADHIAGLLISLAVEKAAAQRLGEAHRNETASGDLGPWASRFFRKLITIVHLAGIVVQGLRNDGQSLLWVTDEDEIAPSPLKHAEATRVLGHLLNCYCTGPMGHFRFGTTDADPRRFARRRPCRSSRSGSGLSWRCAVVSVATSEISHGATALRPNRRWRRRENQPRRRMASGISKPTGQGEHRRG